MRREWKLGVILFLAAIGLARTGYAKMDFSSPEAAYLTWTSLMEQYEGKSENINVCYAAALRADIASRSKSPEGSRRMDSYHIYLNREIAEYDHGEPQEVSDTKAIITLTPKKGGTPVDLELVYEDDGWKISALPQIGSEAGLSAKMLFILGIVLLVIILVLAKKVLLT